MIDKQIQKLLLSQKKQEILNNQLQGEENPNKIEFNSPKIIDGTKSHLHKDENYSNNLSDLEVIRQQHLNHLRDQKNPEILKSTQTKIKNIENKINLIKSQVDSDKQDKEFKSGVIKQLSKEQELESKLHNKIASSTLNYNKFKEDSKMGFTLRTPEAINIHTALKNRDYIDDEGFHNQIQRQLSDFSIKSNLIEKEMKELEKIPGFENKVKVTRLRNELNMRNRFIEKLKGKV